MFWKVCNKTRRGARCQFRSLDFDITPSGYADMNVVSIKRSSSSCETTRSTGYDIAPPRDENLGSIFAQNSSTTVFRSTSFTEVCFCAEVDRRRQKTESL